jgi:methyl acetate hydrolase
MARQADQPAGQAPAEAIAPGMIASAGDRDRVLQERAAGRLSLGGGQPARPGTMVWLAPMTKPITSIAALPPAGQRGLDPGQPAVSILPAFREPRVSGGSGGGRPRLRPPARQATVRHLRTHTAAPFCNPVINNVVSHSELIKRTNMSWLSQSRRRC